MERTSEKKKVKWLVQRKSYMLKLVLKLKTIKSLKLILVDMKVNSSIHMRLGMVEMAQNKQNA